MNPEIVHSLPDKGTISAKDRLLPYITDKNAPIPREWLNVTLYESEKARYRTLYLDPAYTINCEADYFGQPGVEKAMYDASITLETGGFGPDVYEIAVARAKELVGNDNTPRYYEELIRAYHGDPPLRLVHILTAVQFPSPSRPFLLIGWMSPNVKEYYFHAD